MATTDELKHLRKIALPSSIGQHYGKQIFGHEWVLYPWIQYMEQRVVDAILDDTHERYIIINAPPQTGKSSWCGMLLPFWVTGMAASASRCSTPPPEATSASPSR